MAVVDELGLVRENEHLVVFMPGYGAALVFRVVARANKGYERLPYGPLPLKKDETLPTYDGGTATVPADGVMPARAYTNRGKTFPMKEVYDETDMWFVPKDYRERLFHVIQRVTPGFLRCDVQVPINVNQARFQRDRLVVGIDADWGFKRGTTEVVHIPELHYGYRWGNDTNMDVYTSVTFTYAEYIVETPKDPDVIFDVLVRRLPAHWVTLPVTAPSPAIDRALEETYGYKGFKLYPVNRRGEAIAEYRRILEGVKV